MERFGNNYTVPVLELLLHSGHGKRYVCDEPRDLTNNPLKNQAHVRQIQGSGSKEVQNLSLSLSIDVFGGRPRLAKRSVDPGFDYRRAIAPPWGNR